MGRASRYAPEVRERAVRMVAEHQGEYALTVGGNGVDRCEDRLYPRRHCVRWVRQTERDMGQRGGLTTDEKQRMKELEREVRELKRVNEILRKASAFFAQAELDRRPR